MCSCARACVCRGTRGRNKVDAQVGGEGLRIQKGGAEGTKRCCIGVVVVCVSRVVEKPPAISPRMGEVCRVLSREN